VLQITHARTWRIDLGKSWVSGPDSVPRDIGRLLAPLILFPLQNWLVWYSKYYGALSVVMALFLWLLLAASILVIAAALSPALAERRHYRR
jgi:hypothetical protein